MPTDTKWESPKSLCHSLEVKWCYGVAGNRWCLSHSSNWIHFDECQSQQKSMVISAKEHGTCHIDVLHVLKKTMNANLERRGKKDTPADLPPPPCKHKDKNDSVTWMTQCRSHHHHRCPRLTSQNFEKMKMGLKWVWQSIRCLEQNPRTANARQQFFTCVMCFLTLLCVAMETLDKCTKNEELDTNCLHVMDHQRCVTCEKIQQLNWSIWSNLLGAMTIWCHKF